MPILKIASYVMSVKILPSWKSRKFFSAQTYSKTHISVSSIAIQAKPPANCTLEQVKLRTTALQNMAILTLRFRGQLPSSVTPGEEEMTQKMKRGRRKLVKLILSENSKVLWGEHKKYDRC